MGGDDAEADREADAGADPLRLGREEGLEDALPDVGWHARPVVLDLDDHLTARPPQPQPEPARRCHLQQGLLRVDDQVGHHLVQLVAVAPDLGQVRRELAHDLDVGRAQAVAGELERVLRDLVQAHRPILRRSGAGHGEERLDDPGTALGCRMHPAGPLPRRLVLRQLLHHAGIADHDRERVVELVRDAGQEGAQGRQLLALVQGLALALDLGLGGVPLGEVDDRGDEGRLALILDQPRGGGGREGGAVQPTQDLLQALDDPVRIHGREEVLRVRRIPRRTGRA